MFGYYRGRGLLKLVIVASLIYGAIAGASRLMAGASNEFALFGILAGAALVVGALIFKLWS